MTAQSTIIVPEEILQQNLEENGKVVVVSLPPDLQPGGSLRLQAALSGRQYDVVGEKRKILSVKEFIAAAADGDSEDLREFMRGAYARSDMHEYEFHSDHLAIEFQALKPVETPHRIDENIPAIAMGSGQFSVLFFIRGSERWAAETEGRAPVPCKTGTIRAGRRDYKPGAVRLVEMAHGKPTGWEVETEIVSKKDIWHGLFAKLPKRYIEASGFYSKDEALRGIFNINSDKNLTPASEATAVIFEPVSSRQVAFRDPAIK
ncbi:MAG TPA: hypothetical protein VIF12_05295 [Micavibrio sp.]|jgi:hypothetical protein